MLNHDKIASLLKTNRKLVLFDMTASTNDIAWEYARGESSDRVAIFAEDQTSGRGRRANQWKSCKGESLLCSVVLKKSTLPTEIVTLASAVAIAEAIGSCASLRAGIKWPNDIFVAGKKVAGILLEARPNIEQIGNDMVVGFGINCNQTQEGFDSSDLAKIATSLRISSGNLVERNLLAATVLDSLDEWFGNAKINSELVISRWRELSTQLGHRVTIECNNQRFSGQCINVDPIRGLMLQLDRGGVRMFDAAHSTIVKFDN